jgi:hypothetical protein
MWAGVAALSGTLTPEFAMAGLRRPESVLFLIWCALNAEATILAFFIIPVKAKYLGFAFLVLDYFQNGPVMGLFAISVPLGAWFWARRPGSGAPVSSGKHKSIAQRLREKKRERKKSRFKLLEGQGKTTPKAQVPDLRELSRDMKAKEKTAAAAELDRILDKIRFDGMAALSDEERETLDRHSKRLKDGE